MVRNKFIKQYSFQFITMLGIGALSLMTLIACLDNDNGGDIEKSWTHPGGLSDHISPDGQYANSPQVAMDNNGNAIITWEQGDGRNWQIFKSEYRHGNWTHPSSLSDNISPDGQDAFSPEIAMDDNNNAIITWNQSDGRSRHIFMSNYRNGAWTHPGVLSDHIDPAGTVAHGSQVAMDNNGDAIIIWNARDQSDGQGIHIFMSEYRNGSWTHPSSSSDHIPDAQYAVLSDLAMDNCGNAIITWYQEDLNSNFHIFFSEYRNRTWIHPSGLSDTIGFGGGIGPTPPRPKVAMDDNGNAVIAWHHEDSGPPPIFKNEYRNGAWFHPGGTGDKISPVGTIAYFPEVAIDDNGNAIISWYQKDLSNDFQIFKSEYRNGFWLHPFALSDNLSLDGTHAITPTVAMADNGNAIIAWHSWDQIYGSNRQIFKSEYQNGTWTHPEKTSDRISLDGIDAQAPQVAMDNDGNIIIVWVQSDDSGSYIFKSEYR